jgi:hypothetical protein
MDAYREYVERKHAAERRRAAEARRAAALARAEPSRRTGLHWGWKAYWAAWGGVALAGLVVLLRAAGDGPHAAWTADDAVGILLLAWLPFVVGVAIGIASAVCVALEPQRTYNGEPANPWGPTQNQLLRRQNELLERIARR